jgi:hypothetical protein
VYLQPELDFDETDIHYMSDELKRVLNRKLSQKDKNKILKGDNELEKFNKLSQKFRKTKYLMKCIKLNESLKIFCESLERINVE